MFESETVCMMYLLSIFFNQVEVFKPATSKEGNSEVYVICKDFKRVPYVEKYLDGVKVRFHFTYSVAYLGYYTGFEENISIKIQNNQKIILNLIFKFLWLKNAAISKMALTFKKT